MFGLICQAARLIASFFAHFAQMFIEVPDESR
jgi:hypothetical protein